MFLPRIILIYRFPLLILSAGITSYLSSGKQTIVALSSGFTEIQLVMIYIFPLQVW